MKSQRHRTRLNPSVPGQLLPVSFSEAGPLWRSPGWYVENFCPPLDTMTEGRKAGASSRRVSEHLLANPLTLCLSFSFHVGLYYQTAKQPAWPIVYQCWSDIFSLCCPEGDLEGDEDCHEADRRSLSISDNPTVWRPSVESEVLLRAKRVHSSEGLGLCFFWKSSHASVELRCGDYVELKGTPWPDFQVVKDRPFSPALYPWREYKERGRDKDPGSSLPSGLKLCSGACKSPFWVRKKEVFFFDVKYLPFLRGSPHREGRRPCRADGLAEQAAGPSPGLSCLICNARRFIFSSFL